MLDYPYEDLLSSAYKMEEFDEKTIQGYLSQLTCKSLRIANLSKTLKAVNRLNPSINDTDNFQY